MLSLDYPKDIPSFYDILHAFPSSPTPSLPDTQVLSRGLRAVTKYYILP